MRQVERRRVVGDVAEGQAADQRPPGDAQVRAQVIAGEQRGELALFGEVGAQRGEPQMDAREALAGGGERAEQLARRAAEADVEARASGGGGLHDLRRSTERVREERPQRL